MDETNILCRFSTKVNEISAFADPVSFPAFQFWKPNPAKWNAAAVFVCISDEKKISDNRFQTTDIPS